MEEKSRDEEAKSTARENKPEPSRSHLSLIQWRIKYQALRGVAATQL